VVFIAPERATEVAEAAEAIVARETMMIAEIENGTPMSAVLGANYENMLEND